MAVLNYAKQNNPEFLQKTNGELIFTGDGHIITHGVDYYTAIVNAATASAASGVVFQSGNGSFSYAPAGTSVDSDDWVSVSIGKPSTAGTADQAINDIEGNPLITTYLKTSNVIAANGAADTSNVYNAVAVNTLINNALTSALVYKGTIGTGGTITTLPSNAKVGDMYIAITGAPSINGIIVEAGDFIVYQGDGKWNVVQTNLDYTTVSINGTDYRFAISGNAPEGFYAPKSLGSANQILALNANKEFTWINRSEIFGGTADKVSNALTIGSGLIGIETGTSTTTNTFDGSKKVTVNLSTVHNNEISITGNKTVNGTNGTKVYIPNITVDTYGRVSALTSTTLTLQNTTYGIATSTTAGLVVPKYTTNGTVTYGTSPGYGNISVLASNVANRYYGIIADSTGGLFVNVPWTTITEGTVSIVGITSPSGYTVTPEVKLNNDITLTATGVTIPKATKDTFGVIKVGYTTSEKNYAVQLDTNGKAYVNVPWINQNAWSTISVGDIDITASEIGDTIKFAAGSGVIINPNTEDKTITFGLNLSNTTVLTGDTIFNIGLNNNSQLSIKIPTVSADANGLVPKFDGHNNAISSQTDQWVLTRTGNTCDWYQLPEKAFTWRDITVGNETIGDDVINIIPDVESGIAVVVDRKTENNTDAGVTDITFSLRWWNLDDRDFEEY